MLDKLPQQITAPAVMRLLLLSYFAAIAFGLIKGTEIVEFIKPVSEAPGAELGMRALILVLVAMILFGFGRRPAALILSLIVFFASYVALYSGGDIGAFWRDLAFIGGLLMTADFVPARKSMAGSENSDTDEDGLIPLTPEDDRQFREDFDIANAQ